MASSRLPDKPLADLAGIPMVVRVAHQAHASTASRVVVATDDERVRSACALHGVEAIMTRSDHISGSDRLAEACEILQLEEQDIVVNVQGDEPLISPESIDAVAQLLAKRDDCSMSTLAHAIDNVEEFASPHVVKVVLDARDTALYFSRAPIPWWRDGFSEGISKLPSPAPLRHVGLYVNRPR
jgi:3-deoxy-manno-octulosonate cytidylyltransferase (CMP-KDO synthetase)